MIHIPKSQEAPACLEMEKIKNNGDYNCGDVLERLAEDFKNKCYICEYQKPTSINVEHFIPHKGDKDLKFDWNNLFFACAHCNNTKLDKYHPMLDCTREEDQVETCIQYRFQFMEKGAVRLETQSQEARVTNTVALLEKVYMGHTAIKKIEAAYIREKMVEDLSKFRVYLNTFFEDDEAEADEKESAFRKIKRHLKKDAAFRAFKSWMVRDNSLYFNELGSFIE